MIKRIAELGNGRTLHLYRGVASNMYLLADARSGETYLVDCGMPSDAPGLLRALTNFPPLKRVVCTHFHVDHISAWPTLRKHIQDSEIWFHTKAEPYVAGRSSVPMPGIKAILEILLPCMKEYGYFPNFSELRQGVLPGTPFKKGFPNNRVRFFEDAQEILPGFLSIPTPGHLPDEVSFFEPRSGHFISGDFILVLNGRIKVNSFLADKKDQQNSLQRIKRLEGITTICPGHGNCRSFAIQDTTER